MTILMLDTLNLIMRENNFNGEQTEEFISKFDIIKSKDISYLKLKETVELSEDIN